MSEVSPIRTTPPRRWGRILLVVVALALIALVIVHVIRSKAPKPGAAPQVVTVATATTGPMPETLSELGTVTPGRHRDRAAATERLPDRRRLSRRPGRAERAVPRADRSAPVSKSASSRPKPNSRKTRPRSRRRAADLVRFTQLNERKSIAEQTYVDQQVPRPAGRSRRQGRPGQHRAIRPRPGLLPHHRAGVRPGRPAPRRSGQLRDRVEPAGHRRHHDDEADHRRSSRCRKTRSATCCSASIPARRLPVSPRTAATTRASIATGTLYADQQPDGDRHRHRHVARDLPQRRRSAVSRTSSST